MSTFIEEFKDYLYNSLNEGVDEYLTAFNADKNIKWITVKGNHIPIKDGQTKDEAIKEFLKGKDQKTKSLVKSDKTIAGVKKGKPMSYKQANEGRVNPNYNKSDEYKLNCQCCVAVFEARLRGYDIETLPFDEKNKVIGIQYLIQETLNENEDILKRFIKFMKK